MLPNFCVPRVEFLLHQISVFSLKKNELELNKCSNWGSYGRFHAIAKEMNGLSNYHNQHLSVFPAVVLPSSYSNYYLIQFKKLNYEHILGVIRKKSLPT